MAPSSSRLSAPSARCSRPSSSHSARRWSYFRAAAILWGWIISRRAIANRGVGARPDFFVGGPGGRFGRLAALASPARARAHVARRAPFHTRYRDLFGMTMIAVALRESCCMRVQGGLQARAIIVRTPVTLLAPAAAPFRHWSGLTVAWFALITSAIYVPLGACHRVVAFASP